MACIDGEPALRLVVAPDSTLVTLATDASCDPFTLTDELVARGWYVQPQLSFGDHGPSIHLSVSAGTHPHVEEFAAALSDSVAAAQAAGPVAVDPGVVGFIEALDPTALGDDDFDGLLAASGLVGESADGELELPSRMAEVNAMLDVASPGDARGAAGGVPRPAPATRAPGRSMSALVSASWMPRICARAWSSVTPPRRRPP